MRLLFIILFLITYSAQIRASHSERKRKRVHVGVSAQKREEHLVGEALRPFFNAHVLNNTPPRKPYDIDSVRIDNQTKHIKVFPTENFCGANFTQNDIKNIEQQLLQFLPQKYNNYRLRLFAKYHQAIEELIPNYLRTLDQTIDTLRTFHDLTHHEQPWTQNISRPYQVTNGLEGKHLMIWHSHGKVFKNKQSTWEWQRPNLFCTTEDLLSQSIVVPFLFPMLENAGAIVATCRERDPQPHCVVVDNDTVYNSGVYIETNSKSQWCEITQKRGFAMPSTPYSDDVNPFEMGSARMTETTESFNQSSTVLWCPEIPETGYYAVYVSYVTLPNSTDRARYTIKHMGDETTVLVNQQMGGSTWVYLGTHKFRKGIDKNQGVELSNFAEGGGVVSADAVRFGGGMARNLRDTKGHFSTSQLPTYFEAARYYTQWAGLPTELYNTEKGTNDYVDDLRCRPNFTNYLAGGSVYVPQKEGLRVPIELCLAVHTDAGIRPKNEIYGTLSIATTHIQGTLDTLATGKSRMASADFARILANTLTTDLSALLQVNWARRETWNRNYCETREPLMPSAIIELLSHQNFTDMKLVHDPAVKFLIARSLYKAILKYVNYQNGNPKTVVQPLPVSAFAINFKENTTSINLTWQPTTDKLEPSARPLGYVVYVNRDGHGFDNGTYVDQPHLNFDIHPGVQYAFKVTAINEGGESFPSETLTAYCATKQGAPRALIINGFTKVAAPQTIERADSLGFALHEDMGIPYKSTTAFCGQQLCFDTLKAGREGPSALGFSSSEFEGINIAGNTFDYPLVHGEALQNAQVSYVSTSRQAVEQGNIALETYQMIDLILGEQKRSEKTLMTTKTFTSELIPQLSNYLKRGGALFVSGSHVGKDMLQPQEVRFLNDLLKVNYSESVRTDSLGVLTGLNLQIPLYNAPSPYHYAVRNPDVLTPSCNEAFTAFVYENYESAGVAYPGNDYRVLTLAVPFECISDESVRLQTMKAIVDFLLR